MLLRVLMMAVSSVRVPTCAFRKVPGSMRGGGRLRTCNRGLRSGFQAARAEGFAQPLRPALLHGAPWRVLLCAANRALPMRGLSRGCNQALHSRSGRWSLASEVNGTGWLARVVPQSAVSAAWEQPEGPGADRICANCSHQNKPPLVSSSLWLSSRFQRCHVLPSILQGRVGI